MKYLPLLAVVILLLCAVNYAYHDGTAVKAYRMMQPDATAEHHEIYCYIDFKNYFGQIVTVEFDRKTWDTIHKGDHYHW